MADTPPPFRPGVVLVTRFTGTLSERFGHPLERLPTASRLADWLDDADLAVSRCTDGDLAAAHDLREAAHDVLTAMATAQTPPQDGLDVLNDRAASGRATPVLSATGVRHWRLRPDADVVDALGVVAADAIAVASGERDGRLSLCDSPTCRAVFLDTSRSRTRRWCDMNTCGNREKKSRLRAAGRNR